MLKRSLTIFLFVCTIFVASCAERTAPAAQEAAPPQPAKVELPAGIVKSMKAVEPFFEPMGEPGAMDWLASYPESGQTFEEYINGNPTLPTAERHTIYIQPLGEFTLNQKFAIQLSADYLRDFYTLPVKILPDQKFDEPLSMEYTRVRHDFGARGKTTQVRQIRTGYILDELLLPNLPPDAAALIAFTAEDLYPNESMNFVFGQASLQNRVGVWSLNRMREGGASDVLFLTRVLKIAAHETGHMFSIAHCTKYKCVMSGTNGFFESDTRPIDACPECMAKIAWGMKYPPDHRYRRLAEFCEHHGLTDEAKKFREKQKAVQDTP